MDIISIIISIGASVISGMALFFLQRYFKKKEKREAELTGYAGARMSCL